MTETTALSDEEMRKLLKPNPSSEQVLTALKRNYIGTDVEILKELDSYDDRNFLVHIDGTKFLAKIHNGVESRDYLDVCSNSNYYDCGSKSVIHLQNVIMQHLNSHNVPTSAPQISNGNEPLSVISLPVVSPDHSDTNVVMRLLSWIPGRPMSSVNALPIESLAQAGIFLGRMDAKLDLLDCDELVAANRYHAWDGKNTADLRAFVDCILDTKRRAIVESVLDAFQKELLEGGIGNGLRQGIIQGDFNDANILVDQDLNISGVIDFGDSVMSWRVLDISVGMTYAMLSSYGKTNRHVSAASAMLRGFHSVYPLEPTERRHLHLLMACRLACSATLGAYSYQQNPENEYLLLHAEPAWKALELVWGYSTDYRIHMKQAMEKMFALACKKVKVDKNGVVYCSDLDLPDPSVVDLLSSMRRAIPPVDSQGDHERKYEITFVTGNKKKLQEVKRILGSASSNSSLPFVITNHKLDLPELQGDPLDIAKEKCAEAARQVDGPVITEDTSLCFTALKGLPGPYIKWFLDKCGHSGLNDMISFSQDKSAYAQTVVAFCPGVGKDVVVFDGRTVGKIVPPRGSLDFGWDPIFEPDEGRGLTYAEMSEDAKDSISHRSRAFSKLREYLLS